MKLTYVASRKSPGTQGAGLASMELTPQQRTHAQGACYLRGLSGMAWRPHLGKLPNWSDLQTGMETRKTGGRGAWRSWGTRKTGGRGVWKSWETRKTEGGRGAGKKLGNQEDRESVEREEAGQLRVLWVSRLFYWTDFKNRKSNRLSRNDVTITAEVGHEVEWWMMYLLAGAGRVYPPAGAGHSVSTGWRQRWVLLLTSLPSVCPREWSHLPDRLSHPC